MHSESAEDLFSFLFLEEILPDTHLWLVDIRTTSISYIWHITELIRSVYSCLDIVG